MFFFVAYSLQTKGTAYTVTDLLLPSTVSQKDEKPNTAARARSYRNNAQITEKLLEKRSIPQYRKAQALTKIIN